MWQALVEGEIISYPFCTKSMPNQSSLVKWASLLSLYIWKHKTIQKDSHSKIKLLYSNISIITEVNMAIHKVKANEYRRLTSRKAVRGICQREGQTVNMEPGIKCSKVLIIDGIWHELIKWQWVLFIFLHSHSCEKEEIVSNRKWEETVYKKALPQTELWLKPGYLVLCTQGWILQVI